MLGNLSSMHLRMHHSRITTESGTITLRTYSTHILKWQPLPWDWLTWQSTARGFLLVSCYSAPMWQHWAHIRRTDNDVIFHRIFSRVLLYVHIVFKMFLCCTPNFIFQNTIKQMSTVCFCRIPVLKLPTSPEADTSHYPPELMPSDEGPCAPQTQSGAYTVLPPIGRSNASDTQLFSDRSEQQLDPIHRSSSEGYLSQMERHRQLKAKGNYKVCV